MVVSIIFLMGEENRSFMVLSMSVSTLGDVFDKEDRRRSGGDAGGALEATEAPADEPDMRICTA